MKRFAEYLNEDFDPAIFNADGGISINDPTVVDAINSNLEVATSCSYRTPYNGLEEVAKTLAYYKIFLPKGVFLDQNHGNDVFEVSQFGEKMGMNNQGEVVTASDSPLFVYFEWSLNEKGMYDTFACLCDQEELDEILADFDSEVETDEDLQEQHSIGKVSKMLYKIVNQQMADKNCDDVDDYIEHEKQGKTFTQVNEEVMPNPKKKMAAKVKAITLAGQMRKEETVNEIADTPRGKEAVRQAVHRADATAVDSAINPRRGKKGKRELTNAMNTIRRGIAVHKKQGNVLDPYLKRVYGLKKEETINEVSRDMLSRYIKKAKSSSRDAYYGDDAPTSGKRKKGIDLALKKKWGDKNYGTPEPKVKATNEENLNELSKKTLADYIKKASHDVATKSAATGRYADRANKARDKMKKGDYSDWQQGKKDDEFADKMFKKSWNRRKGIAKAADKLATEKKKRSRKSLREK